MRRVLPVADGGIVHRQPGCGLAINGPSSSFVLLSGLELSDTDV